MTEPTWDGMTLAEMGRELKRLQEALGGPDWYDTEARIRAHQLKLGVEAEARQRNEAASFRPGTVLEYPGSLADSLARPRPAQRSLIEGLWGVAHNLSIEAVYKTGKTVLLCSAAGSLADGRPFLGFADVHPPAGPVALWNCEMDPDEFDDFLLPHVTDHSRVAEAHLRSHPMPVLISAAARAEAVRWLRWTGAQAWGIDSWTRLCAWNGIDPLDNFGVGRLTAVMDEIKGEAGITALAVTGHMPHAARTDRAYERGIGAQAFSGWVDAMWRYTRDGEQRFLSAEGRKVHLDECQVFLDAAGRLVAFAGDREQAASNREAIAEATAELALLTAIRSHPGLSTAQLRKTVSRRKQDVALILAALAESGLIYSQPGLRGAALWYPAS
jgi:hypothetical protein